MKTVLLVLLIVGVASAESEQHALAVPSTDTRSCGIVTQAMSDYFSLKPGSLRKEVEGTFELDGGAQFALTSRYVYKKCPYIHIDIEFKQPNTSGRSSPDDTIVSVSKLYLQYPAKD